MSHCGRYLDPPLSRREMLVRSANGFGAVALAGLLAGEARGRPPAEGEESRSGASRAPHFAPRVRSMIFLYMDGGPSQVDLFPFPGAHADDLCVIRSMVSNFSEHTSANFFIHTGLGLSGRPSMGSWLTYGLGSETRDLPGFVVLNGGLIPPGGLDNFSSGFLPAAYQGSILRAGRQPVANIEPLEARPGLQLNKLDLLRRL